MNASTSGRCLPAVAAVLALLTTGAVAAQAEASSGYLGVMLQDISPSMAKALQLDDHTGVLVTEVVEGSPADEAGLQDGDVILEFDGKTIDGSGDLTAAVRAAEPGDKVKVLVLRDGEQEKIKVEIGEKEAEENLGPGFRHPRPYRWHDRDFPDLDLDEFMDLAGTGRGYVGIGLGDLTDQLGEYFGVEDGEGVLITEVHEDSPAAEAGLKAGDVIVKLDDRDIDSSAALLRALRKTDPGDEVSLTVVRKGKRKTFKLTLAEMPEDARNRFPGALLRDDDMLFVPRHRLPEGDDQDILIRRHLKGSPRIRMLREEFDDHELDELHQELDKLRSELDKLRQEVEKLQ